MDAVGGSAGVDLGLTSLRRLEMFKALTRQSFFVKETLLPPFLEALGAGSVAGGLVVCGSLSAVGATQLEGTWTLTKSR